MWDGAKKARENAVRDLFPSRFPFITRVLSDLSKVFGKMDILQQIHKERELEYREQHGGEWGCQNVIIGYETRLKLRNA